MQRSGVVLLVLMQAVSYAVPALVLGLALAALMAIYMAQYFHSLTAIRLSSQLSLEVCIMDMISHSTTHAMLYILSIRRFHFRDVMCAVYLCVAGR